MRRWIAAAAALVLLAIVLSGDTPWRYTLYGVFAAPDFAQDLAAARVFASDQNPYEAGIAEAHAELMRVPAHEGYPHFPHPPLLFLLILPMAGFTLQQAAPVWFCVSLGLLFLLAAVLADVYSSSLHGNRRAHFAVVLIAYGALFLWPPVQYNLAKGQWSIVVALLLALCWRFHVRGQHGAAGASLGIATAIKLFPALLGFYFLARTPRAVVWMAVAAVATLGLPLVWMGPQTIRLFIEQSQANVSYWETFPAVTYSIHGLLARMMIGGQWARPLVHEPLTARILGGLLALVLFIVAARTLRRRTGADEVEGARFAAWTALLVVLNPLAMAHTGVLLALPILLIARALSADERVWPKLAWTIGVALVSIPGHTLIFLASQPIEPWQGPLVIALPLWGTLLLLSAAIAATTSAAASSVPSPRRAVFVGAQANEPGLASRSSATA
jgi:hypothetical protein